MIFTFFSIKRFSVKVTFLFLFQLRGGNLTNPLTSSIYGAFTKSKKVSKQYLIMLSSYHSFLMLQSTSFHFSTFLWFVHLSINRHPNYLIPRLVVEFLSSLLYIILIEDKFGYPIPRMIVCTELIYDFFFNDKNLSTTSKLLNQHYKYRREIYNKNHKVEQAPPNIINSIHHQTNYPISSFKKQNYQMQIMS